MPDPKVFDRSLEFQRFLWERARFPRIQLVCVSATRNS